MFPCRWLVKESESVIVKLPFEAVPVWMIEVLRQGFFRKGVLIWYWKRASTCTTRMWSGGLKSAVLPIVCHMNAPGCQKMPSFVGQLSMRTSTCTNSGISFVALLLLSFPAFLFLFIFKTDNVPWDTSCPLGVGPVFCVACLPSPRATLIWKCEKTHWMRGAVVDWPSRKGIHSEYSLSSGVVCTQRTSVSPPYNI